MCGIALIVSGIRIDLSPLFPDSPPPPPIADFLQQYQQQQHQQLVVSVDELKAALRRRGPDSLGSKRVRLFLSNVSASIDEGQFLSAIEEEEDVENGEIPMLASNGDGNKKNIEVVVSNYVGQLQFVGATLQLRGLYPVIQPLVDSFGNVLVYNGEIFGGIHVDSESNDGEVLMRTLGKCCSCTSARHTNQCSGKGQNSIPDILSMIKGPWAVIYWQDSSKTLWFGRDAFGRRSLLVHWPTVKDSRFLLSSVSPFSSVDQSSDLEVEANNPNFWEELTCGIYSLSANSSKPEGCLVGEVKRHEWANTMLVELIKWERVSIEPRPEELQFPCCKTLLGQHSIDAISSDAVPVERGCGRTSFSLLAQKVLNALRKSVMLRTLVNENFKAATSNDREEELVPVAILFSGGLDSMILAALLHECLDPSYEVDLLNVSFDGRSAPDRISALAGVEELTRIAPLRRWNLVEIDADLSKLTLETKHVMSLINPANTYMDLNIGIALWLAASGDGWVYENHQRSRYKSKARIVLVGSGADEQCAGYGRHKTKYRCGGWLGLNEEMKLDIQRIWKRNMGRDDRCISDRGKEARCPFLDEDVMATLLDIPLWEVANLNQPSGTGDKKILREVAQMLGLYEAAVLPKRAIQFGSRIARESNRKNFGSNRAANQASAGSVVINMQCTNVT